eukprot:6178646-Pleurochrysis_carterae.AAC.2
MKIPAFAARSGEVGCSRGESCIKFDPALRQKHDSLAETCCWAGMFCWQPGRDGARDTSSTKSLGKAESPAASVAFA